MIQRYGLEVNGGAELHCRQLAEHMLSYYDDIEVLTTKALDYISWADHYEKDEEDINGIHVRRFSVEKERDLKVFAPLNRQFEKKGLPEEREEEWLIKQGPYAPAIPAYIRAHRDEYEAFIFFTYLYYTTVEGIKAAGDKAVLIPTAHEEPAIHMHIYDGVFNTPRGILYNTAVEMAMVNKLFHNEKVKSYTGGVGVELPESVSADRFRDKYGADPFMLYVGRLDEAKGGIELLRFFSEYKRRNPSELKLRLMGKSAIKLPDDTDIIPMGFVSDEDKFDGMAAAAIVIMPSPRESLSMVVLEGMKCGAPVIVNGNCDVLKDHCLRSNGALYYQNYFEFEGCVDYLLKHEEEKKLMSENAIRYVDENYRWDIICERLCDLI